MKRLSQIVVVAAALGGSAGVSDTLAQEQAEQAQSVDVKALLQRITELEGKVRILESNQVGRSERPVVEKSKSLPAITVGENGFSARSADTNFVVQLHGLLQVDNRSFFNDGGIQGNDGFLLRRARPILSGTVFHDFDFMFVPDFGGSTVQIFDAYLNYRYQPWLQLRAGKAKTPVGLEYLQSDTWTFFNERSLVTGLVPGRDLGFQVWGDISGGVASYAVGIFNGVGDARNSSNADFDDNREFAGRIFLQPFKKSGPGPLRGLGIGVGGSFGHFATNSTGLPNGNGYVTDGQQQFFAYNAAAGPVMADGDHWRLSPQVYYYCGPFGVMAEYAVHNQRVRNATSGLTARLEHHAWQVSGSWVLTGEDATFIGVTPRHAFDPRDGHWGAFQVVGRFAELDIDDDAFPNFANPATSASAAQSWSMGLNWYLNRDIILKASYSRTTFTGGGGAGATAPATVTRQPEETLFTRLQLAF